MTARVKHALMVAGLLAIGGFGGSSAASAAEAASDAEKIDFEWGVKIPQPDTDFRVDVYEIRADGSSIKMTGDVLRARYRESSRSPKFIRTQAALRYDFDSFTFVSQELRAGSRLRLVVRPVSSIYAEKNYNSDGEVAAESVKDARAVSVLLYHDSAHPSTLLVPIGAR
jgi:hypothetical protein